MTEIVSLSRPAERTRFRVVLPLFFAAAAMLGAMWPGHAGQLFAIGSLAGIWASFVIGAGDTPSAWLVPTLLGGVPILWFLGRLLDRLNADLRVWCIALPLVAVVAGYVSLQGFADLEAAVGYHGSFLAFCICALQLGSYGATMIALAVSGRAR